MQQRHPMTRRAFELLPELIELRRQLHRHPELGFDEHKAVAAVSAMLLRHLPDVVALPVGGTGLIAHRRDVVPAIALRACLDALPIDDPKDVEYASTVPGVCHACGHDAQAAAVVGALVILGEMHPDLAVAALFQPAEEIDTGALAVLDDPAFGTLLSSLQAMIGIHGHSGLDAGQFGIESGPVMACITTVICGVTGTGGHGAEPHLASDAVTAAASLVLDWQVALARRTDPRASVVLSVGRIAGGTTSNVIPERVEIEATLRYLDPVLRPTLHDLVEGVAAGVRARFGVDVKVDLVEVVPAVVNDPAMVDLVERAASKVIGGDWRGQIQPSLGGDDFAYYSSRCRSCYVFVGERQPNREPYGWHNPSYDIDETSIAYAAAVLAASAVAFFDPSC